MKLNRGVTYAAYTKFEHRKPHLPVDPSPKAYPIAMESFRFQTLIKEHSFPRPAETKNYVVQKSTGRLPTSKLIPRRLLLHSFGFIPILSNAPLIAKALEMKEPEVIRTQKLDSGVRLQDIIDGEGKEAREGDLVEINYVCRRSNGYFVHSTVDQFTGESSPVKLLLSEKEIIKGLKEVIIGMKTGGKRRALVPPSVGYVNENLGPIPEEAKVLTPNVAIPTHLRMNELRWAVFDPKRIEWVESQLSLDLDAACCLMLRSP